MPFSCPAARTSKGTWSLGSLKMGEDDVYTCEDYGFFRLICEDDGFRLKTTKNINRGRNLAQNDSN